MIFGFDISISNYLVFRLSRKTPQGIRLLFALKIRLEEGEQMDIKSPVVITDSVWKSPAAIKIMVTLLFSFMNQLGGLNKGYIQNISLLKVCVGGWGGVCVCKPNLVKCFGPRLLLWTCVLWFCQGQAFQLNKYAFSSNFGLGVWIMKTILTC